MVVLLLTAHGGWRGPGCQEGPLGKSTRYEGLQIVSAVRCVIWGRLPALSGPLHAHLENGATGRGVKGHHQGREVQEKPQALG